MYQKITSKCDCWAKTTMTVFLDSDRLSKKNDKFSLNSARKIGQNRFSSKEYCVNMNAEYADGWHFNKITR